MEDVVWIGITLGLGVAAGMLAAALLAAWRHGLAGSIAAGLVVGVVVGLLLRGWLGLPGAVVGPVLGALSATLIARGALRRGGTPGGTAFLVGAASIAVAALAFVPLLGYAIAVLLPVAALRRTRGEPDRFAGLRTLAK